MIGSLRGRVADVDPEGELLVDVAGVGYRVAVSPATLVAAGDVDGEVELWVSQAVRDDVPRLFGFLTRDERVCFEQLLGAHGVGPALALAVLSHLSPDDLRRAVLADDHKALTLVPGVGQRTAQRMLIDLKAKLGLPTAVALVGAPASGGAAAEVRAALEAM
ncbi:MAG TPA: Holliday junction branch migration protein RuvA, partial [Acidimicrobiaceae bacterium]|nr:Holliday junction branch migration protein RuvA [Acidimicrobiaceae bacterium]